MRRTNPSGYLTEYWNGTARDYGMKQTRCMHRYQSGAGSDGPHSKFRRARGKRLATARMMMGSCPMGMPRRAEDRFNRGPVQQGPVHQRTGSPRTGSTEDRFHRARFHRARFNRPGSAGPVPQTRFHGTGSTDPVPQTRFRGPGSAGPVPQTQFPRPGSTDQVPQKTGMGGRRGGGGGGGRGRVGG